MTKIGQRAIRWMKAQIATSFPGRAGFCLGTVRRAFDAPGMLNATPAGGTAKMAWDRANNRQEFDGDYDAVPAGWPFCYAGGSKGYGHIVVTAGNGKAYGTDGKRFRIGHVDLISLKQPVVAWGMRPLGIIGDINGKYLGPLPPRINYVSIANLRPGREHEDVVQFKKAAHRFLGTSPHPLESERFGRHSKRLSRQVYAKLGWRVQQPELPGAAMLERIGLHVRL